MKTKEELDELSHQQIEDHRREILLGKLTNDSWQYMMELEYYQKTRFKEKEQETFNRWKSEVENAIAQGKDITTDIELSSKAFITSKGFDTMYEINLSSYLDKIGEFKFIKIK